MEIPFRTIKSTWMHSFEFLQKSNNSTVWIPLRKVLICQLQFLILFTCNMHTLSSSPNVLLLMSWWHHSCVVNPWCLSSPSHWHCHVDREMPKGTQPKIICQPHSDFLRITYFSSLNLLKCEVHWHKCDQVAQRLVPHTPSVIPDMPRNNVWFQHVRWDI